MSYTPVVGIGGGVWRAYATADRFRFPMFQPDLETFNKDVFPHARAPWVTGARAVMTWHLARGFWYAAAGNFLAKMLLGSYAMSVATVGEMADPRLKDYIIQIRQRSQQRQGGLSVPSDHKQGPGYGAPPIQAQQHDDASPTGEIYTEEDFQEPKPAAPARTESPLPQEKETTLDFFDDASPTGGQGMSADTRGPSQPAGSAWDRIRRGQPQTRGQSQQSAWQKRRGDQNGDQGEASVQQDAQTDFDAKVERERRGGNFSGGSDQKRW
jgi:hypothetical protein